MHRIFVPRKNFVVDIIRINDVNYIKNVLRLKQNDKLIVYNGEGKEYIAIIDKIKNEYVECKVLEKYLYKKEGVKVILLQSILKGKSMDVVLQKVTELGVDEIIPVITDRTIIRVDKKEKIERWQRIIEGATAQSKRLFLPKLDKILKFNEAIIKTDADYKIIFYENATKKLKDIIEDMKGCNSIAIFIGPEGSFTERELKLAQDYNFIPVSISKNILRAETCAIVSTSLIMYELKE